MLEVRASDLKTILHSARANIYYLEHCRVLVNGGRVEYVTDAGKRSPLTYFASNLAGQSNNSASDDARILIASAIIVPSHG